MEYKVEEISPVEKSVKITVPAQEVDAAILAATTLLRDSVQLDGFRKGKAPLNLVQKQFHDRIYNEAFQDLMNAHINNILTELDVKPVSGIDIPDDDKPLVKGQPYEYTLKFEVLPPIDLPPYEGMTVEQKVITIKDEDVDKVLHKMMVEEAKLVPVSGNDPAKEGEVANIDFEFLEDGKPVKDLQITDFNLELGTGQALEDFEKLVMSIPVGHTGEGEIKFPEGFIDEELAGKTLVAKITVHAVKKRDLVPLDDEFAKKHNKENLEDLQKSIREMLQQNIDKMCRNSAQSDLLEKLMKMTDFTVPSSKIKMQKQVMLINLAQDLEQQGRSLASLGKSFDKILEDIEESAQKSAKEQTFLLTVAKKENIEVSEREVNMEILAACHEKGEDFRDVMRQMRENGTIYEMRDRILAEKALDSIYSKANVVLVNDNRTENKDTDGDGSQDKAESGTDANSDHVNESSQKNTQTAESGE